MQKVLKLHPHRHTGRLLHHRHTSYRSLLLVMVLAGACLGLTNRLAEAASYGVSAQVLAPIPSGSPAITSPTNGSVYAAPNITIAGSCPIIDPRVIVVIYDGTTALGSQQCSALGSFAIPITLREGIQSLLASVVTITNETGGSSTPIYVSYQPGVAAATTTTQPVSKPKTPRGPQLGALEIRSKSPFLVYGPSKPAVWEGSFAGGQSPYTISFAWGDGDVTWLRNVGTDPVRVQHQYDQVKPSYRITITLRDSAGHDLQMRTSAVSPAASSVGSTGVEGGSGLPFSRLVYLIYLLTLLVLFALWAVEHNNARRLAVVPVAVRRKRPSNSKPARRP